MKKLSPKESLADQAFNALKDAIINGKLAQQEELPEEKLALDLGISRTPLREALKRLAAEGLVEVNKAKPAIVATFTKEDGLHYMEIRRLLEIYNIDQNANYISEEVLCALEENLVEQFTSIKEERYNKFNDLDQQFHLLIGSIGPNRKLSELINDANAGSNRAFLILSNTLEVSAEEAYYEHEEIVRALRAQENDLAKQLMVIHLDNVERRFLLYFDEEEEK